VVPRMVGRTWLFWRVGSIFRQAVVLRRLPAVGGLCDSKWVQGDDDYALIAARRGPTPMMFMTRVRL